MVTRQRVLQAVSRRYGDKKARALAARIPDQLDLIADAALLRDLGLDPEDVVGVHTMPSRFGGADPIEVATWSHDDDTPDNYHLPWRKLSEEPVVGSGKSFDPANKHYHVEDGMFPL